MKFIKQLLKKYNQIPIAAKATIWFMFCTILQKSISLITTPIFTRMMSTEQYGQFSVYNSWLQIFTIITTMRLNWAVFNKGMSKYKDDRDGYTSTMQTLTTSITLIVFVIYLIFHKQINALTELPTFIMLAIFAELLVTPAIDFWTIRKRYEYIYKPVVFRTILMAVLNAGIGVCAVFFADEKGYARILSCVLVNICFGTVLFVYNLKKGKKLFCVEYVRFALLFNLPLLLHYLSTYILDQFDRIMIQKMVGFSEAGIYSVAYNAGLIMKIVTQSINNALVPWQYDKLEKKDWKALDNTLFYIFVGVGSIAVLFCAFAPELLKILADKKYYEAIYVIPAVALGMFFSFMYTTFANTEFFFDQNKFTMYISMSGAVLNIVMNYICIMRFGYVSAGYTTLVCYVLFALIHYFYMIYCVKKKHGLENIFNGKRLLTMGIAILLLGVAVINLYDQMTIRYTIILIVLGVAFGKRNIIKEVLKIVQSQQD